MVYIITIAVLGIIAGVTSGTNNAINKSRKG
jgi:hypothetical protein